MNTRDAIKSLESAIKNNNEWFYDRPSLDDRLETMYRLASSYCTLCHKWTILNRSAIEALAVITTQQQTITELEAQIATLKEKA